MGASIGKAMGLEKAMGREFSRKTVAVIGDSPFLHSGIAPLIDVVYNRCTVTVVILDNGTTAMTGNQTTLRRAGTRVANWPRGWTSRRWFRACGVKDVSVVDPYDPKTRRWRKRSRIARGAIRGYRQEILALTSSTARPPVRFLSERCIKCGNCFRIGCPAMEKEDGRPRVNETLCNGCYMCVQLCKSGALAERRRERWSKSLKTNA
jgi:indolepyruvate ferredoxin oxidoreductase alpha subunit